MKYFLVLIALVVVFSCSRKIVPVVLNNSMESKVVEQDSVVVKHDTTFCFDAESVQDTIAIDTLKKHVDSTFIKRNGKVNLTFKIDDKGNLFVDCKSDSLKAVINNWIEKYSKLVKQKNEVKEVGVPYPVDTPYIPKWVWYVIGIETVLLVLSNFKRIIKLFVP